jgi:hypothetical protein
MALNIYTDIDVTSGGDDVYESISTCKANWAIADAGTNSITTATTTLTTSQVNNLRATPISLVAAPGAGYWLDFRGVTLSYNYTTTAFTVAGDEDLIIRYDGGAGSDLTASIESAGFLDQTNDEVRYLPPATWTAADDIVSVVNKKIEIFNTGAGETSVGGTSTLIVKVMYMVHATGL